MGKLSNLSTIVFSFNLFLAGVAFAAPPATEAKKPAAKPAAKTAKTDPVLKEFLDVWAKTSTFEADLTQSIEYIAMGDKESSKGHVWVHKPGRLRWDEENASQRSSQILNRKKLSSIVERIRKPGYRTIDVWENGLSMLDKAAFSFLTETGPLTKAYDLTLQKQDGNSFWVQLRSKLKPSEPLVAEISKPGYVLRALSTETPESRVRIEFTNIKANQEIPNTVFEWTEDKEKDRVVHHK